jgi:peptidoglycan/LPS O-acetylase OafA/YrhL
VAIAATVYCALGAGPIRLIMFISGILLFEAMDRAAVPTPSSTLGVLALSIGLLSALIPVDGNAGYALKVWVLFIAFFIVCLSCFRHDTCGWLPRGFCWTPLRWLGNMSYSYYLLHGLVLKAGFLVLSKLLPAADGGTWLFWFLLPLMFVLTLIPTSALFLLIERPFSLAPRRSTSA